MLERGEYKDRNALRYGQKISPEYYQKSSEKVQKILSQRMNEPDSQFSSPSIHHLSTSNKRHSHSGEDYLMAGMDKSIQFRQALKD